MRFFSNFRGNKVFLALVLGACAIPAGYAQNARVAAAKARAAQIAAVLEELPPAQRRHLSSAAQNIIQFAHRDEAMEDSPDIPQLANQLATIRNSPVRPTGLSLVPGKRSQNGFRLFGDERLHPKRDVNRLVWRESRGRLQRFKQRMADPAVRTWRTQFFEFGILDRWGAELLRCRPCKPGSELHGLPAGRPRPELRQRSSFPLFSNTGFRRDH